MAKYGIPNKPGYYWRKLSEGKVEVVRVYSYRADLFCDYYKEPFPVTAFHKDSKFYGPIEEPNWEAEENDMQLELSVVELEKLVKDAEWAAREHWRLTVQSRSQKEHERGIFLNQLRDKLQAALRLARRA